MIVVFDSVPGNRAAALREIILLKGYPCAAADAETVKMLNPVRLIVTFTDQIDTVRRMPYDGVPVVACGQGFVNSALNAVRVETPPEMFDKMDDYIRQIYKIHENNCFLHEGAFFWPGVYLSEHQLIVYGSRIDLTETELMIMKCLILAGDCYRSAEQIASCCCPANQDDGNVRVHIFNINKKGAQKLPRPLVESKHGCGYRFGYIEKPEN